MVRSKSDISNHAIRVFLQEVGKFYDEKRGFKKFISSKSQKKEILQFFNMKCCFCEGKIDLGKMNQDHLVPMNKVTIGLHSWGNVVPCCQDCNIKKNKRDWISYLKTITSAKKFRKRKKKIHSFIKKYKYKPNLHLHEITNNLYQDIGEVAETLIRLRYKQAEEVIKKLI